jgi:beta-exotoxin I transport system permease protein
MRLTLFRKLLRDSRAGLIVTALLLAAFQCLWAKITSRILGELSPFFTQLASFGGKSITDIQDEVFQGPGQIVRTLFGGEQINLERAMDMLSIGYVHPLVQTIFCIWAVGRASGAIAGELDRGTMELLLAQPLSRTRLILAHLGVDTIVIPTLCLSLWAGTCLGTWLVGPIHPTAPPDEAPAGVLSFKLGPIQYQSPIVYRPEPESPEEQSRRLRIDLAAFGPSLWAVGGLLFAISGYTMALSACGRYRWRVLGAAVFVTLVQFLVNVVGQMWDVLEPLRPWTIFYYYQPQDVILGKPWAVIMPALAVLYGVGLAGYATAFLIFTRRDLPAPL